MASTSIADIVALIGGPGLDDGANDSRLRLTGFLSQPKWDPEDLRNWVEECFELASRVRPEYYYALQDIVVSVGCHMGFEVEYGSYTSTGALIAYDGKWRTLTGEDILVEVKSSPWPLGSVNQLGSYMDEYAEYKGCDPSSVYGMYAIGYGDFTGLVDQIRGSNYRHRIKVISFPDLIRLFSLSRLLEQTLPPERAHGVVQDLLLPFESIDVGNIITIIQGVAMASEGNTTLETSSRRSLSVGREWARSELHDFLIECQPNQIALVAGICSTPTCVVCTDELLRRMRLIAPYVKGMDPSQVITQKTINGTRSGLTRKEQQLGKDSYLEYRAGRYSIREEYRDWVVEWVKGQGLYMTSEELVEPPEGMFVKTAESGKGSH